MSARNDLRTFASFIIGPPPSPPNVLNPIGGVSAMRSPTTSRNRLVAVPSPFRAENSITFVPRAVAAPPRMPFAASNVTPGGRPFASSASGRVPVTGRR